MRLKSVLFAHAAVKKLREVYGCDDVDCRLVANISVKKACIDVIEPTFGIGHVQICDGLTFVDQTDADGMGWEAHSVALASGYSRLRVYFHGEMLTVRQALSLALKPNESSEAREVKANPNEELEGRGHESA